MPVVIGLTYLFNLFDLYLGFGNDAYYSFGSVSSCVILGADCPFGHGILYVKMGLLCVTFLFTLPVTDVLEHCPLTRELVCFLEVVVDLLCLLPM